MHHSVIFTEQRTLLVLLHGARVIVSRFLGELWGIWEAAIKPELCHRRGGVINCSDYYREFLQSITASVYKASGGRGSEEVGDVFDPFMSTLKYVCVAECITASLSVWEACTQCPVVGFDLTFPSSSCRVQ